MRREKGESRGACQNLRVNRSLNLALHTVPWSDDLFATVTANEGLASHLHLSGWIVPSSRIRPSPPLTANQEKANRCRISAAAALGLVYLVLELACRSRNNRLYPLRE